LRGGQVTPAGPRAAGRCRGRAGRLAGHRVRWPGGSGSRRLTRWMQGPAARAGRPGVRRAGDPGDIAATLADLAIRGHLHLGQPPPGDSVGWLLTARLAAAPSQGAGPLAGCERVLVRGLAAAGSTIGLPALPRAVLDQTRSELIGDAVRRGWFHGPRATTRPARALPPCPAASWRSGVTCCTCNPREPRWPPDCCRTRCTSGWHPKTSRLPGSPGRPVPYSRAPAAGTFPCPGALNTLTLFTAAS
jgi:hypothetical protein